MNRRDFLRSAGVAAAAFALPKAGESAQPATASEWRTFEVTTRVEVLKLSGGTRIWVPTALLRPEPFQRTLSNTFNADGGSAKMVENKSDALGMVAAEFPAGVKPVLTVTSRIATRNVAVDFAAPGSPPKMDRADLEYFV